MQCHHSNVGKQIDQDVIDRVMARCARHIQTGKISEIEQYVYKTGILQKTEKGTYLLTKEAFDVILANKLLGILFN